MKTKIFFSCIILFLNIGIVSSQTENNNEIVKFTEFGIPSSGAFSLLGTNPSLVNSPGFTKDFKINYCINDGKILDNIAIDAQPFWILLFKNKSVNQYRENTSLLLRQLSKVNFSVGTAKKDNQRQFAYSFKFTIQKDPMMDKSLIDKLENITSDNLNADKSNKIMVEILKLKKELKIETDQQKKDELDKKVEEKYLELNNLSTDIEKKLFNQKRQIYEKYVEDHWTDFAMDIGIGQLMNYNSPSLDSLKFINNGFGIWINPTIGLKAPIGEGKIKMAALFKWVKINSLDDIYGGINLRYGSSNLNAFVEFVYESNNKLITNTIAYGASYKIDNKKLIEFGLRHQMDKNFALNMLYPVISINWVLAKDMFK
ncbi:MAG: hypothetical protein NTZ33_15665 [Bacteroidetes bacterium]|nr:hypothetical protein [Bacteroidota bacterium]